MVSLTKPGHAECESRLS